jgi:hypothetical protein
MAKKSRLRRPAAPEHKRQKKNPLKALGAKLYGFDPADYLMHEDTLSYSATTGGCASTDGARAKSLPVSTVSTPTTTCCAPGAYVDGSGHVSTRRGWPAGRCATR